MLWAVKILNLGLGENKVGHDYIGTIQRLEGLTDFKCSAVEYVGGFVVKQVERNLKCAMCRSSLTSGSESLTLKLVNTKDKGGLTRLNHTGN